MKLDPLRRCMTCAALLAAGCTTFSYDHGPPPPPTPAQAPVPGTPSTPPATQSSQALPAAVAATVEAPPAPRPEVPARLFLSPQEQRDELATHVIYPWLILGAQLEFQSSWEKQGQDKTRDTFLDSFSLGAKVNPADWLTSEFEFKYDFHDTREFSVDDWLVRLGGTKKVPWYVEGGHTSVPFGEFNSHFKEDPLVQTLGEIQLYEMTAGYDTDPFEALVAVFRAKNHSRRYDFVGEVKVSPVEDMDVGAYWTNDIGESVELHQNQHDAIKDDPTLGTSPVAGAGGFFAYEKPVWSLDFEYVQALQSFAPGLLVEQRDRPWAFDLEGAVRPFESWEFSVRLERAHGLPDAPDWQYGIGASYGICAYAYVSLEYLRGVFIDEQPDRHLILAGLTLKW